MTTLFLMVVIATGQLTQDDPFVLTADTMEYTWVAYGVKGVNYDRELFSESRTSPQTCQ